LSHVKLRKTQKKKFLRLRVRKICRRNQPNNSQRMAGVAKLKDMP
jgi:hypothetical protein